MRSALLKLALILCAMAMQAQVNPHTQIRWPAGCMAPGQVYNWQSNQCMNMNAINPIQVVWPATCIDSTMVYSPQSNICVKAGTAANPAGSSGNIQFNNAGLFGAVGASSVDTLGNVSLPALLISKDNSASTSMTTMAYPSTNITNQNWNSCWLNVFAADPQCGTVNGTFGPFVRLLIANPTHAVNADTYLGGQFHLDAVTGGINQSSPTLQKSNWTGLISSLRSYTPGQHFGLTTEDFNASNGDTFGIALIDEQWGNTNAAGDEGEKGIAVNTYQGNSEFNATVSSIAGNVINYTGASSDEPYSRGEQRLLIDTTTGVYSTGTISAISGTPPTVTGSGTGWSSLGVGTHANLCFELDGGNAANSFLYVLQINSIVSDTSLTLLNSNSNGNSAWQGDATTGTYKIYKCSITTAIAKAGAVTVVDGTQFNPGDAIRMPIGNQLLTIGVAIQLARFVPGGIGNQGLSIANNLSGNPRTADKAIGSSGNFTTMWSNVASTNANRTWFTDQAGPASLWNITGEVSPNTLSLLSVNRSVSGGNYVESYGQQFDLRLFNGAGTYRYQGLSSSQARFDVDTSGGVPTFYVDSAAANAVYINNSATLNFQSGNQSGNTGSISAATGVATLNAVLPKTLYSAAGTALPACGSTIKGEQAVVSDATTPTYMGTYTSGGLITAAVICSYNGTTYSWLTH